MKFCRLGQTEKQRFMRMVVKGFVVSSILIFCFANHSFSMSFDLGPDTVLDFDTTIKYGISVRTSDADPDLLANINGDDGNRAFDKGDLISNRLRLTSELDLQYKRMGFFARGATFYDDVYNHDSAHDSPGTNNNFVGGSLSDHQDFTDGTLDRHRSDIELLDLYAYGNFFLGDRELMLRVGRQVVSWGESLFTFGSISAAQSYGDATQLNVPGVELKDLFLPSWQALGQIDVTPNLTFAAYYQWEWEANRLDESGSFFSTMDMLDEGGSYYLGAPNYVAFPRIADKNASDTGQWGVSLRYLAEELNATEFGLYFLKYHEKMPLFKIDPAAGGYFLDYDEDITLIGASVGTVVGDTNVGLEVAYRKDLSIEVNGALPTYKPFDIYQVLFNFQHIFGPRFFTDNLIVTGEGGFNQVIDGEDLAKDQFAWGYTVVVRPYFYTILPSLDVSVPLTIKHKVNGDSSLAATWNDDENEISLGFDFVYNQDINFGIKYTEFLGDADDYAKSDRDNLSFTIKYTF